VGVLETHLEAVGLQMLGGQGLSLGQHLLVVFADAFRVAHVEEDGSVMTGRGHVEVPSEGLGLGLPLCGARRSWKRMPISSGAG
jgi:hypothetical protein